MKKSVLKYIRNFKKVVLKYPNNHCLFNPKILNKMLLVVIGRPVIPNIKFLECSSANISHFWNSAT